MKSAAITGTRLRYDVPTKCTIVSKVLDQQYDSQKAMNAFISALATEYRVNALSIKLWCAKYALTYLKGKELPIGTMSFEFEPIQGVDLHTCTEELSTFRKALAAFKARFSTAIPKTPTEVLQGLVLTTKA